MRRTRPPSAGSTKKVSCIWRAGWSLPRLSASKFIHSDSTSGPSTTSQPIPTKASIEPFLGQLQRVPGAGRAAVHRPGDVDGLLDEDPPVALLLELGLAARVRAAERGLRRAHPLAGLRLGARGQGPDLALGQRDGAAVDVGDPRGLELVQGGRRREGGRRLAHRGVERRRVEQRRPRQGRTGCSVRTSPSFPCRPGGPASGHESRCRGMRTVGGPSAGQPSGCGGRRGWSPRRIGAKRRTSWVA